MDDQVEEITYVSGSLATKRSPRSIAGSVTKSEVSMVDAKFQSNSIKSKLKVLFKNIDSEKKGCIKNELFF